MAKSFNRWFHTVTVIVVCLGAALMTPVVASGQGRDTDFRSVEVVGTGKASATPDKLVVKGFLSAQDETAKKVLGKFLKTKKSLEETINPMDFAGVEIEYLGSIFTTNLNSNDMLIGATDESTSDGYYLTQPIRIRIKIDGEDDSGKSTLEMLSKLVDSAESVGVVFDKPTADSMGYGPGAGTDSLVFGELKNRASLESEATQQAFDNAKAEAERLAKLAGGKLGKVISIHASSGTQSDDPTAVYTNMILGFSTQGQADSIQRIETSQSLRVMFELID